MLWWRKDFSTAISVQNLLDMPLVGCKVDYRNYTCGTYNSCQSTEEHHRGSKALLCIAPVSSKDRAGRICHLSSLLRINEADSPKLRFPRKRETDGLDSDHIWVPVFKSLNKVGKKNKKKKKEKGLDTSVSVILVYQVEHRG